MPQRVFHYVLALIIAELAILPWTVAGHWIEPSASILFLVAIILSAWFGGLGPGIVATNVAAITRLHYFLLPTHTAQGAAVTEVIQYLVFIGAGVVTSGLTAALKDKIDVAEAVMAQLEPALLHCPLPLFAIDGAGKVTVWNPAAERLFRWTRQETVGRQLPIVPDDKESQARFRALARSTMRGENDIPVESRYWTRDRHWIDLTVWPAPTLDKSGRPSGVVFVADDATERKQYLESLRGSEARFRTLAATIDTGILILAPDASVAYCNPASVDLLGMSERQILGQSAYSPIWQFLDADGGKYPCENYPMVQAVLTGEPVRNIVMGLDRPKTGDRIWLLLSAEPQWNTDGAMVHVVCTLTDITQHRRVLKVLPAGA